MLVFVDYLYKGIGGVGQIVTNSVFELNRRGLNAKVYASKESYEYQRLAYGKANCQLIDSDTVPVKQLHRYLDREDVIFLTHIDNTILLESIKIVNNKLIFYSVFPDTFFYQGFMYKTLNLEKKALDLISLLDRKKAMFFMDRPNVEAIERRGLGLKTPIRYLPVPVHVDVKEKRSSSILPVKYNITYVGRGNDDWKIFPVIKVLQDLSEAYGDYTFTICTDTADRYKMLISENIPNNRIPIEYKINLFGKALDEYLINNSWLHIAMGTSALEGAKLRIPTILIDYSMHLFPENYVYKWIFQVDGFSLGEEIRPDTKLLGEPMIEIISELMDEEKYQVIADRCFEYVSNHHSLSAFVDKLLSACEESEMTIQDYCNSRLHKMKLYILPFFRYIIDFFKVLIPKTLRKKMIRVFIG